MSGLSHKLKYDAEWRITLFTVVMLPLLVGLGFWQLQRAGEKAALAVSFEERQQRQPARLDALWEKPAQSLAYLPVRLRGSYLPQAYFLLDNQVRGGQFGYEVLGVLQLADQRGSVLVNRGWVAGDVARRVLPEVPVVDGPVEITGYVYVAPGAPFLLAEQHLENGWPKRIQAVEMDKLTPAMAALQAGNVFPFPVRINAGQPGALVADWQIVNVSPQKHQAYAVQWFAMAGVLLLFFVLRSTNLTQLWSGRNRASK
jgi:cytochrome oxidase assembly protein ShyY1